MGIPANMSVPSVRVQQPEPGQCLRFPIAHSSTDGIEVIQHERRQTTIDERFAESWRGNRAPSVPAAIAHHVESRRAALPEQIHGQS